jgi:hypothetical protein
MGAPISNLRRRNYVSMHRQRCVTLPLWHYVPTKVRRYDGMRLHKDIDVISPAARSSILEIGSGHLHPSSVQGVADDLFHR